MTARRDLDNLVRAYLDEGPMELPNRSFDAVRNHIDHTRQRVVVGPWRMPIMTKLALTAAAAATVLVVAVVGYNLLPGLGIVGPGATPSPSPALLARGNFVTSIGEVVELEATREGSSVAGRMTVSAEGQNGPFAFTADLQCARTTEDGLIMIGGVTTDSTGRNASPEGTWAGIVLERGSPVEASTWRPGSASQAANCWTFLDEQLMLERSTHPGGDWLDPIEGTVELGP